MLMQTLLVTYRDLTRQITPGQPVTTVPVQRDAANSNRWVNADSQARRLRRQRRLARTERHNISGWTVRAW